MTDKLAEVTILTNDESIFGDMDFLSDDVDVQASIEKFQKYCRQSLEGIYPECDFVFKHEKYSGKSILIKDLTEEQFDPLGYESDNIAFNIASIYDAGLFWVTK